MRVNINWTSDVWGFSYPCKLIVDFITRLSAAVSFPPCHSANNAELLRVGELVFGKSYGFFTVFEGWPEVFEDECVAISCCVRALLSRSVSFCSSRWLVDGLQCRGRSDSERTPLPYRERRREAKRREERREKRREHSRLPSARKTPPHHRSPSPARAALPFRPRDPRSVRTSSTRSQPATRATS